MQQFDVVVIGAGVIGIEYASMFAGLGTRVTVVDARHIRRQQVSPQTARPPACTTRTS